MQLFLFSDILCFSTFFLVLLGTMSLWIDFRHFPASVVSSSSNAYYVHFLQGQPSTSLCVNWSLTHPNPMHLKCGYYISIHLWLDLTCHYVVLKYFCSSSRNNWVCCLGVDLYISVLLSSFRYGMNETEVADLCYCLKKCIMYYIVCNSGLFLRGFLKISISIITCLA